MMNIIVACCKNNGIGFRGKLPWHFSKDLKYFKNMTIGEGNNAVIMGRKTWLKTPLLPKRDILVLTTNPNIKTYGRQKRFNDIESLKTFCEAKKYDNIWIAGGGEIYKQFIHEPYIDSIYATYIDKDYLSDSFFPPLPESFKLASENVKMERGVPLRFQVYRKDVQNTALWDKKKGSFKATNLDNTITLTFMPSPLNI